MRDVWPKTPGVVLPAGTFCMLWGRQEDTDCLVTSDRSAGKAGLLSATRSRVIYQSGLNPRDGIGKCGESFSSAFLSLQREKYQRKELV